MASTNEHQKDADQKTGGSRGPAAFVATTSNGASDKASGDKSNLLQMPSITLPKGGGAMKSIDEKFAVNAANGTASYSIPLPFSAGRKGATPELSLSYNSGGGNSWVGLGWGIAIASIQRKTEKELPAYRDAEESDTFIFSGAEDLIPELVQDGSGNWTVRTGTENGASIRYYRPRIESGFARIEMINDAGNVYWRVRTKDNMVSVFGQDDQAKLFSPVVSDGKDRIFRWCLQYSYDDKGNLTQYIYKQEDGAGVAAALGEKNRLSGLAPYTNLYPKRILYGNSVAWYEGMALPVPQGAPSTQSSPFLFEMVLDYGEHDDTVPTPAEVNTWVVREDPFSDYRPGFEVRTYRLCQRLLMFHHFSQELGLPAYLVRSTDLEYEPHPHLTYLVSVTQTGYIWNADGSLSSKLSLPPMTFNYVKPAFSRLVQDLTADSAMNAPEGFGNAHYQWTDLYSEGISGILTEQGTGWYYKENLGNGSFSPARIVSRRPSLNGLSDGMLSIQDLEADGHKYLVSSQAGLRGYYPLDGYPDGPVDGCESGFRAFEKFPNIDLQDPNLKLIDLNGDGMADMLLSYEQEFVWYASLGRLGYDDYHLATRAADEESGPQILFSDKDEKLLIATADMSGDGLSDIVLIRAAQVCYYPNLGYGRFGARVTLGMEGCFDSNDSFNPGNIHLSDIDGSGTTDIAYIGSSGIQVWFNQSGNSLSAPSLIFNPFPETDPQMRISFVDLLGTGVPCIVWCSGQPSQSYAPIRYIDIMESRKPHVMEAYQNNLGKEVTLSYQCSTQYYLSDKLQGIHWVTRLPFPVQCVSQMTVVDKVAQTRFTNQYSYHHGYYDAREREFRGFAMVEQTDSEEYDQYVLNTTAAGVSNATEQDLYQPVVTTRTWYHTGAYLDRNHLFHQLEQEYFPQALLATGQLQAPDLIAGLWEYLLDQSSTLPDNLEPSAISECYRALKGLPLRQEVYSQEGDAQTQLLPYSVVQHNYDIQLLQPRAGQKYACFLTHEKETLTFNYERNPLDPRITHEINVQIDPFGNVLQSASIAYGRQKTDPTLPTPADQQKQSAQQIVYTQTLFTTLIDTSDCYRLPVGCETQVWELNAMAAANLFYGSEELSGLFAAATVILFEQTTTTGQKRKISHNRTLFLSNDLSGPMPLGSQDTLALPYQSYVMAFTPTLAPAIYGGKFDDATWRNTANYILLPGDVNYWIPAGRMYFHPDLSATPDAQSIPAPTAADQAFAKGNFYLPVAWQDNFGNLTKAFYDSYKLTMLRIVDAVNSEINVDGFHYRTLAPWLLRDFNDNRTAVRFNELGFVIRTFVMGKSTQSEGDPVDTGSTELSASDEPSSIITYNYRYYSTGGILPDQVQTSVREQHYYSDPLPAASSGGIIGWLKNLFGGGNPVITPAAQVSWMDSYSYTDGSGHEVLKKVQAEPGLAPLRDAQGNLVLDANGNLQQADTGTEIRWVGNGRIIYNNKGKPVKRYEPYFDSIFEYNDESELVELGFTAILYYDALGRVMRTDYPNGTFSTASFTAWSQKTFDQNDTVMDSAWYTARINGALGQIEQDAARKAALHYNTPQVSYLDSLGRNFLEVADNKTQRSGESVQEVLLYTRRLFDIQGHLLSITDANNNVVMSWLYDMPGNICYQHSMDGGDRWLLTDVMGKPAKLWDSRGQIFGYVYDSLHRPTQLLVNTGAANTIFEQFLYGEGVSGDKQNNLRGKLYNHYDTAGLVNNQAFDFKGNLLASTRTLLQNYQNIPDWSTNPALNTSELFQEETAFDALSRPIQMIAPDKSIFQFGYNQGSLLNTVDVQIRGAAALTHFITQINYDAKKQRQKILYGNNTTCGYTYDPMTYRLIRLLTTGNNGSAVLQDLNYTYDPVGNITTQMDNAQKTIFYGGQQVNAQNGYIYDALYRLVQGQGREHTGQVSYPASDNWNDSWCQLNLQPNSAVQLRNYTQKYFYDGVGNMLKMQHVTTGSSSWTRTFQYNTSNNQLIKTSVGGMNYIYSYNPHGSMLTMPQLSAIDWNFREELQHAGLGGGGDAYFVYDSGGNRVRKVIVQQGNKTVERIYLGMVEIYRERTGTTITLERSTLHVMDDEKRIAMIDSRTKGNDGTPAQLIRYQYNDHVSSACLELDDAAKIITYEEYHPFGTTAYQATDASRQVPSKRYRYTGMERDDETGMNYHSQRYYAPWLGRWMASDPVGITAGMNLYAYAKNNPVVFNDPTGNDPPASSGTTTPITDTMFHLTMPSRFDLTITQDATRLRFLGQAEVMHQEHILVSPPGSPISSNSGSLLLNSASIRFSHLTYSLRLDAQATLTPNFTSPGSYETDVTASATVRPVFSRQDGQYRLFNAHANVHTAFLSVDANATLQLRNTPDAANLTAAASSLITDFTRWHQVLSNYTLHTLGANMDFNATLRVLGLPVTYAFGNTNFSDSTHLYVLGATIAPAGTLFDLPAPLIGGQVSITEGVNGFSGKIGFLPLISPSAISAHAPTVQQFPIYGYLSAEYSHRIPHVGTLSTGVEGYIDIGETVSPVAPDTSFNAQYDELHNGTWPKAPLQVNGFVRIRL